jgi:transglutaminase-like putative cysteine protease
VSPSLLPAQFQEPAKEELQMANDPKAPGADAVYLNVEDITDQNSATRTYYMRIKVLTEKGMERATVHVPHELGFEKIADVQGRTIHADGTVIPLTEKPSDVVDVKTKGYERDDVVFTLPSAEVGSILEYRVRIKYPAVATPAPTWTIQQDSFVHKAHYSLKTLGPSTPSFVSRIGTDAKIVEKGGTFTLDLADVPPLPDDDWMPPLNAIKWRVHFFYPRFSTMDEYWKDAGKYWGSDIREVVDPWSELKRAVRDMVAPGDSETQKARKIYAAVMKLENTDFTRKKSKAERKKEKIKDIHTVEDVWKQQRGVSDDIALLYVALARAAGLKVDPMMVVDRSRALFDRSVLSWGAQPNDYIAVAQLDGKQVYLDPGEKWCPFGMLHWKHTLASGFRLVDKVGVIEQTPSASFSENSTTRVADLSIDETGKVTGSIRVILTGQSALAWRQQTLQYDEDEIKKQFNDSMRDELPDGVQADFDHFLGLDDYTSNLIGIIRVKGNLGVATGKRFFLPGLFFESHAKHPFVAEAKRTISVDVHYPRVEIDDVTYSLPPGYRVESAPQRSTILWPSYATLKIKPDAKDGSVTVVRTMAYGFTILDPNDYSNLHEFFQKVATADQQQVVLTRASAVVKGN